MNGLATLRRIPDLCADGPTQMALDEALLEVAAGPTIRLYGWNPPTVSLGYFQDFPSATAGLPAGMAVVRRITGGGAIWHESEVTYALVGRLGQDGFPATAAGLYPLLHSGVAAALAKRGVAPALQSDTCGDRRYRDEPRCFASPAKDDLVAGQGGKLLGSAARTRGTRVLVHGSLKLASNPWDGSVVAACGTDAATAAACLVEGIAAALGLRVVDGELDNGERAGLERIRTARYGDDAWVRERRGPPA